MGFTQGYTDFSIFTNQCDIPLNKLNHIIISIDTEKAYDNIQHPFMITLQEVDIEGTYLMLSWLAADTSSFCIYTKYSCFSIF